MPQQAWSAKRERQYKDIKKSELERGAGEKRAERIAAATVNKTRAEHGETESSRGRTRDELYAEARRRNIDGRSKMTKQELANALGRD
ncbi:plasmid stabilization protein [Nocardia lasii]|uniref:Plasmid stabilization protein n=1 Tax=Nocardia lasii TaxID=1616107 RepID=A0ABW1JW31_9NOCA